MTYCICLIEGDGIGHEVIPAARRVLGSLPIDFEFISAEAGWDAFTQTGTALPEATLKAVRSARATLFGAVSSPLNPVEGYRSPIVALRRTFDLFANLRPITSQPLASSRPGIDMLIVRENTEGLYAGRERATADEAVTERVITRRASERIVRLAFQQALQRRRKVTIVHKANVLKATCGLFRQVAFEVASEFPTVQVEEALVDSLAMRLVMEPDRYDVIVTTNLFGDILSDEAAGLVGGLGLAPSANVGLDKAIFEPVHGSAPDIAGQGIANPLASVLAAGMMLQYLNEPAAASQLQRAVTGVLHSGKVTPDLGGTETTESVTAAVIEQLTGQATEQVGRAKCGLGC